MSNHQARNGEIVVEIDHPRNCDYRFFPIGENVRSRVIPDRSGEGKPSQFTPIHSIPGERIHIDVKAAKGRITDGLADETVGGPKIMRQIQVAAESSQKFSQRYTPPGDPREVNLRTKEDVDTWLYWMARVVESGIGRVVQGTLEESDKIVARGNVKAPISDPLFGKHEFPGGKIQPRKTDKVAAG